MITITLPLPSPHLSPNARAHWRKKARVVRDARLMALSTALNAGGRDLHWKRATTQVVFYHAQRRKRDGDNALASLKAYFDGIADAGGGGERRWSDAPAGEVRGGCEAAEGGDHDYAPGGLMPGKERPGVRTPQQERFRYNGLTPREFGEAVGISVDTVRSLIADRWFRWTVVGGVKVPECMDTRSPKAKAPQYHIHRSAVTRYLAERAVVADAA